MAADLDIKHRIGFEPEESYGVSKTIQAKTFQECVGKMISHLTDEHPEMKQDQIIAVAHEKCRTRFPGHSKASLVRTLEKSNLVEQGSLRAFLKVAKGSFKRDDWIAYAVLLRKEGMSVSEVAKRISYGDSWIKKYVNPKLSSVTDDNKMSLNDEQQSLLLEAYRVPILDFQITNLEKAERIFEGWGSVEVIDSQDDMISIDALERIMPIVMKRGGVVMFSHSNRHVGRLLKYKIKNKAVNGKSRPGVWLKGQIFSDYQIDDQAWESIQLAKLTGQSVISLGATPRGKPKFVCDGAKCFRKIEDLEVYEWSITNLPQGSRGANPEATIDRALEKENMASISSDLVGGTLFSMKKQGTLPEPAAELVDFMLSRCDACQSQFLELTKGGLSDVDAKNQIHADLMKALESTEKEITAMDDEIMSVPPDATATEAEEVKDEAPSWAVSMMKAIESIAKTLVAKQEPPDTPVPEEEEDEVEEAAPEEKQDGEEAVPPVPKGEEEKDDDKETLTLSKAGITKAQFDDLAKQRGFVKTKSTPAPSVQDNQHKEIVKSSPVKKKKYPSQKERLDALASGNLSDLAEQR